MIGSFVVQKSPKNITHLPLLQKVNHMNNATRFFKIMVEQLALMRTLTLFKLAECARIIREFEAMLDKQPLSIAV